MVPELWIRSEIYRPENPAPGQNIQILSKLKVQSMLYYLCLDVQRGPGKVQQDEHPTGHPM